MSALFDFQAMLIVIVLLICTSSYLRQLWPSLIEKQRTGFMGMFRRFAVVGDRLSPYVSASCAILGIWNIMFRK